MQRRSKEKITFPFLWTNTCCSHPLYPNETNGENGVISAAIRKLNHELGIDTKAFVNSDFCHLDCLRYKAACDDKWGENEGICFV